MDHEQFTRLGTYLEMVPDPRRRRGRRYGWAFLLALICLGPASGQKTVWGIAQWVQLRQAEILKGLESSGCQLPSPSTLYRVLREVDVDALEQCIGAYGKDVLREMGSSSSQDGDHTPWCGVAIDGKEVRGAARHGPKVHLVSMVSHDHGLTLAQRRVTAKAYEPAVLPDLFGEQDLSGMVITMDALYTHDEVASQILDRHGHYLMVVKENQPQLCADIAALFAGQPLPDEARWAYHVSEKAHGRLEERHVVSSEALNGYLNWPQLGQVIQRVCTRRRYGATESHTDTNWAVTSLTHAQASPEQLFALWRGHWTIENRSHYVRDETMGEDRGQIARGNAPQALASLRNAVITTLRSYGWPSIAQATRFYAANLSASIQMIASA